MEPSTNAMGLEDAIVDTFGDIDLIFCCVGLDDIIMEYEFKGKGEDEMGGMVGCHEDIQVII